MGQGDITLRIRVTEQGIEVLDQAGDKTAAVGKQVDKTGDAFKSFGGKVVVANQALELAGKAFRAVEAAIRPLVGFLKESTDLYGVQELAITRLNASLKSTGQFTSEYSGFLQELARQFQSTSVFGDELVLDVERQLVAFGAARGQVQPLTQSVLDLASGLGIDLRSATLLVGKAVAGDFGTLSRYGILVDKNADKSTKLAQAIAQINSKFGGQAQAEADTYSGKIKSLANIYGDFQEKIGAVIANSKTLRALFETISETLEDLGKRVEDNGEAFTVLFDEALDGALNLAEGVAQLTLSFAAFASQVARAGQAFIGLELIRQGEFARGVNLVKDALDGQDNSFAKLAKTMGSVKEELADFKARLEENREKLKENAEQGDAGATAFRDLGTAAQSAAPQVEGMSRAGEAVATGMKKAAVASKEAAVAFDQLKFNRQLNNLPVEQTAVVKVEAEGSPRMPFSKYFSEYAPRVIGSFLGQYQDITLTQQALISQNFSSLLGIVEQFSRQASNLQAMRGDLGPLVPIRSQIAQAKAAAAEARFRALTGGVDIRTFASSQTTTAMGTIGLVSQGREAGRSAQIRLSNFVNQLDQARFATASFSRALDRASGARSQSGGALITPRTETGALAIAKSLREPTLVGPTGNVITFNFQGITDEEFFDRKILPKIERALDRGQIAAANRVIR